MIAIILPDGASIMVPVGMTPADCPHHFKGAMQLPDDAPVSIYWSGEDWFDKCRRPHRPSTGKIDLANAYRYACRSIG